MSQNQAPHPRWRPITSSRSFAGWTAPSSLSWNRRSMCASLAFSRSTRCVSRRARPAERIPVRRRQHVNPLGFGLRRRRSAAPELPPDCPLELEIGCADAQFLFERAMLEPGRFYVGLDIRHQLVDKVNRRARADAQPVLGIFAHANLHL